MFLHIYTPYHVGVLAHALWAMFEYYTIYLNYRIYRQKDASLNTLAPISYNDSSASHLESTLGRYFAWLVNTMLYSPTRLIFCLWLTAYVFPRHIPRFLPFFYHPPSR
jgi:hypothetical protein